MSPTPADVDGYVLAGGLSARMGRDKATARHGAGTLLDAALTALRPWCARVRVVRRPGQDPLPADVLWEPPHADPHPLRGVAAALADARAWALVLPVDVVDLDPGPLLAHPPAVAWDGAQVHALVALLPADWAPRALALAEAGAPARELVAGALRVPFPPASLRDRNRPEDLAPAGQVVHVGRSFPLGRER